MTAKRLGDKMNHTPYPWKAQFAKIAIHIVSAEGETIATVNPGLESKKSDALLISSAPLLYEALIRIKENVFMNSTRFTDNENKAIAFALTALDSISSNCILNK